MNNPAAIIEHIVRRYFIWIICYSYLLAGLRPQFGLWVRGVELGNIDLFKTRLTFPLPSIKLGLLLFNGGLGVKATELKHLLGKPFVLLGGAFGNLLIPLAFILAMSITLELWHNPAREPRRHGRKMPMAISL
jgi:BASS family bile acid:Na+ symporter